MKELQQLFNKYTGNEPTSIVQLSAEGSNRGYYRLSDNSISVIGVVGESILENKAFIKIATHFSEKHLNTPKVFEYTADYRYYIQEDLGDIALYDEIQNGIATGYFSEKEKILLLKTIEQLPKIQFEGGNGLDYNICYPQPEFDRSLVMWDLNYFKYSFLKTTGIDFLEPKLEEDFQRMADDLLQEDSSTFLYRDFQSRNVMIKDGCPYFIDFQGGRKGPIYYDVASFVWQSKAKYPNELKEEMLQAYLKEASKYITIDAVKFRKQLNLFILFRLLQTLGAYGFRGYFEQKQLFIDSIPLAIENLKMILKNDYSRYPYLLELLAAICEQPKFKRETFVDLDKSKLTVTVKSFSFKKGIPEDPSGNGGGYVFDCRGMHNPGRYEEYKQLTGLDKLVINYLEEKGEIQVFLNAAYKLADAHIQDFLKRGFTHVMFSFGCTGGQHRSVYCAQHLAEYVSKKYGVKVSLNHREQNISKEV